MLCVLSVSFLRNKLGCWLLGVVALLFLCQQQSACITIINILLLLQ